MEFTRKKFYYPGSKRTVHSVTWVRDLENDNKSIEKWCLDTFGPSGYREDTQDTRWVNNVNTGDITFLQEQDLVVFLLRWE